MRRNLQIVPILALAGAVAAGATVGASAAKAPVRLAAVRAKPVATIAWTAAVVAAPGRRPSRLIATNGTTRVTPRLTRTGRGRFRARLTFPFAGSWRLAAQLRSRLVRLGAVRVGPPPPVASAIPGASAIRICGDTGTPYPQYALARDGDRLWVSCRDRHWLQRVDAGNLTAQLGLGTHSPVSIAVAAGAVWTSDRSNSLTRIDTATGRRSSQPLESDSAYLWAAAGSIWVAEDSARTLARVDPASGQVRARIQTGDGTSAFVVDGRSAWMVNHRDGTLDRIDLVTNALTHLGRLPGDAPERMVMLGGSLWVTGRGTDLLRVDPATGAVQAVVDMGAGAIDLAAAGGSIWVFAPTPDDDRQGLPIVERVVRVDPATNAVAQTVRTTGRVVLNGLVSDGSAVWLADTSGGRLYRLAG